MKKLVSLAALLLALGGCGGGGGGGGGASTGGGSDGGGEGGTTDKVTTISGTVSLSSSVSANKPTNRLKSMYNVPQGHPASRVYQTTNKSGTSSYQLPSHAASLQSCERTTVYLYNSDHPEWLDAVAEASADESTCAYSLSALANAAKNSNGYTDGDPIPQGNYTLLVVKEPTFNSELGVLTDMLVAVQTVVNEFVGEVSNDMVVQPSAAAPTVEAMLGLQKNSDGTQTWGSASYILPPNAAIQVSFSMAVARGVGKNDRITISPTVSGHWEISSDWLSATFYSDAAPGEAGGIQENTEYTVTVLGGDQSSTPVTNVYGNALAKTATATFTSGALAAVDMTAPTVTLISPNLDDAEAEKITDPIRVRSNERIDINALRLSATDNALGARPGVNFVRQSAGSSTKDDATDDTFDYEFSLGQPLKLGTEYSITISGGTDMSGNVMASITASFTTESAENSAGISSGEGVSSEDQSAQSQVADIFGKWTRAMNDHNLAQMQSLMSGDFVMAYNTSSNDDFGIDESDINRDGVWDLKEFGDLLQEDAFKIWEHCGTSITGTIGKKDGTDKVINVDLTGTTPVANFSFHLTGTSTNTSKDCTEAAPEDNLFAILEKINGAWTIVKASEGIDVRTGDAANRSIGVVTLGSPANQQKKDVDGNLLYMDATGAETTEATASSGTAHERVIVKNPKLVLDDLNPVTFNWVVKEQALSGVDPANITTYVMLFIDARDPDAGFAVAFPPTYNSLDIPTDVKCVNQDDDRAPPECETASSTFEDVSEDFGFHDMFEPRPGSTLLWQVVALKDVTTQDISSGRATDVPGKIIAVSQLGKFSIEGEYQELKVSVLGDLDGDTVYTKETEKLSFNEFIDGYDALELDAVKIVVHTPVLDSAGARIFVGGNTFQQYQLTYTEVVSINGKDYQKGTKIVQLNKGSNWIDIEDGNVNSMGSGSGDPGAGDPGTGDPGTGDPGAGEPGMDGPMFYLHENFQVTTDGGIPPVVEITSVTAVDADGVTAALTDDGWDFYNAPGTVAVIVEGLYKKQVDDADGNPVDTQISELYLNLWNDRLHANAHRAIKDATCVDSVCTFSVQVEIYAGENWIDVSGGSFDFNGGLNYSDHFGVYTDTGVAWTPPITVSSVAIDGVVCDDTSGVGCVVKKDEWGNGANYDASAATDADNYTVVVTGSMRFFSDTTNSENKPRYDVGSEGGWQGGNLTVKSDGTFTLKVELFEGKNFVNFNDIRGNWYGMDIFTDAGKTVVRPGITSVTDGAGTVLTANQFGDYQTDQCSVSIAGTAMEGDMQVFWNGNAGGQHYWEEQRLEAVVPESGGDAQYEVTINLVGGNMSDNWIDINDANWNWMGLRVVTTGDCVYTLPELMVAGAIADQGSLTEDTSNNDPMGFYYMADDSTTTSVSVNGTSNQASRKIVVESSACGGVERYETSSASTADNNGDYPWSISGVPVYDGGNHLNISDGISWYNIGIQAMNGITPTPVLQVTGVTGATKDSTVDFGCDFSRWGATNASDVTTITGTTTGPDGTGEFNVEGAHGQFEIVDGTFTIDIATAGITLYQGFNFINLFDTNWNFQNIELKVESGPGKPQYVEITAPAHAAVVASGSADITAVIYKTPSGASDNFKPERVNVFVNDWTNNSWTEYSSDPNAAEWGAQTFTLPAPDVNGNYAITLTGHTFSGGAAEIRVSTEGKTVNTDGVENWINHEHVITINDEFGWTSYYKGGAKPAQPANDDTAAKGRALKRDRVIRSRH